MGLALYAGPDTEPVDLSEVKAHLRVDLDGEDSAVLGYLASARAYLEEICNRSFLSTTWDYTIDSCWPWAYDFDARRNLQFIELPRAPLSSVTSITYIDTAGVTQTLASNQYLVDGGGAIGRIYPAYGVVWPSVREQPKTITVRFVAGYGAAAAVPEPIKQATLLLTAHFYAQREPGNVGNITTELPMGVAALIAPYRVFF